MRAGLLIAALLLAGCGGLELHTRDVIVGRSTISCLSQGMLLYAVRVDDAGDIVAEQCMTPRAPPEFKS